MSADETAFKIWGVDNVVYGPVELLALVGWVKEERVIEIGRASCRERVWR